MRSLVDHRLLEQTMNREGTAAELFDTASSALEEIASGRLGLRAVRHPLGFLCFPVQREGDRGVCVHAFDTAASEMAADLTTSPVHSHSWELTSCVLYGDVGNLRVRVLEQPEEPTHRVFEVRSSPSGLDDIRPTSRLVSCEPGPEQTSARGEIYTLPAGEFHATVVPQGSAAATLVLGRSLPGRSDLSLGPVHGTVHQVVRQTCDAGQTARTARTVLRRIHAPRPR
ncbi:hypothetical protein ABZW18_31065 [Streptomyces sp. NPDC004647]|uniref:hypothetical protein n=1 Tax=Streptomyces sp. NPDC004647 TaxID=3154671 RepID=UPI0033B3C1DF